MRFLVFLFLLLPSTVWGESWLCIVEASGGLEYDTKAQEWKSVTFNPGKRYVLRPFEGNEGFSDYSWQVSEFGERLRFAKCEAFDSVGVLSCITNTGGFTFDKNQLTFRYVYLPGIFLPEKHKARNTPNISTGKCAQI